MIAVSDSSPIILLAKIGHLHLLRDLFDEVAIPAAVRAEILAGGGGRPGAVELVAAPWIVVQAVTDQEKVQALLGDLGPGESEVIVLAQEKPKPVTLLLDDAAGRRLARQHGFSVLGSAGILVQAKERGLIPLVQPVLDDLRAAGLYLSDALYRRLLQSVLEGPDEAGPSPS